MKNYKKILPYIILAELISLVGFLVPEINSLAFFAIIALTLVAAMISLELGLLILFTELFIGSKGQLFFFEAGGVLISIRIALWLVIMSVWAGKFLNLYFKKEINLVKIKKILKTNFLFSYFLIFLFFVAWGVINGFLHNNAFNNIFFDANGWLYLLLIFPIFTLPLNGILRRSAPQDDSDLCHSERSEESRGYKIEAKYNHKRFKDNLSAVFLASIIWLSIKTLILLYFFSHNIIGVVEPLYRWVRLSGVGEITNMESGFTRIFFQSHVFVLVGIFFVLCQTIKDITTRSFVAKAPQDDNKLCHSERSEESRGYNHEILRRFAPQDDKQGNIKKNYLSIGLLSLLLATTIVSFSRSNWLGLIVGLLFYYFIILLFTKRKWKNTLRTTLIIFLSAIFSLILIAGIIKFPLPAPGIGFSASLIQNRAMQISGEAGVSSRWALLPELLKEIKKAPIFGAGFGATVTYKTSDPRVLEQNPNGQYTTYAFEWGFLDIWLKLGLLGLSAYLALIIMIFVVAFNRFKKQDINICHSDPAPVRRTGAGEESRGYSHEILRRFAPSSYAKASADKQDDTVIWGLLLGLVVISTVSFFSPYLNHPLGIGYVILCAYLISEK